jgi:hypothetical protein
MAVLIYLPREDDVIGPYLSLPVRPCPPRPADLACNPCGCEAGQAQDLVHQHGRQLLHRPVCSTSSCPVSKDLVNLEDQLRIRPPIE